MKTLVTGIAVSALTAASAEAQESRRVAPPAVYKVAPGLGHFTDDVLFGEFWVRKELSPRDRSLVTIATLVATGRSAQLGSHVRRAFDNGVQPGEVGEVVTHLAFYSGWPNAISAVLEVEKVFDERKIAPVTGSAAARIQLEAAAEAARGDAVDTSILPTAPVLADLTNRVLFGDLWQRPDLSARDRSLITVAALVALGQPDQLAFHANRAMDNGLTRKASKRLPMSRSMPDGPAPYQPCRSSETCSKRARPLPGRNPLPRTSRSSNAVTSPRRVRRNASPVRSW